MDRYFYVFTEIRKNQQILRSSCSPFPYIFLTRQAYTSAAIAAISLVNYRVAIILATMIERIGTRPPRRLRRKITPVTREIYFSGRIKGIFASGFHRSSPGATQLPHFPIRSGSFRALGKRSRKLLSLLREKERVREASRKAGKYRSYL